MLGTSLHPMGNNINEQQAWALSSGGDSCPFTVSQEYFGQFKEVC